MNRLAAFVTALALIIFYSCVNKETANTSLVQYEMKTFRIESSGGCATDTSSCASYTIEYPVFQGLVVAANDSLQKKISQVVDTGNPLVDTLSFEVVGKAFIENFEETKKEFPEDDVMGWYYNATVEVNVMSDSLISLSARSESFTGGAHGGYGTYFININPATGETLTLNDFLKQGYEEELGKIAEQEFRKSLEISNTLSLADAGFEFADDRFKLNSNYGFTSKGILFVFNIYEIAPYILGAQEVLISYERIKFLSK